MFWGVHACLRGCMHVRGGVCMYGEVYACLRVCVHVWGCVHV